LPGVTRFLPGGICQYSGDGGLAINAGLYQPWDMARDRDAGKQRVRAIRYGAVLAPVRATIQAAAIGTTIRAMVFHQNGKPAPSVRVDFAAPSTGATCTLSSAFAITNSNGVATVSCTPGCAGGTYSVTARPLTATSSASVSFTNVGRPCHQRAVRH